MCFLIMGWCKILNEEKHWNCFEMLNTWSQWPLKWHAEFCNLTNPRNSYVSTSIPKQQFEKLTKYHNYTVRCALPYLKLFLHFWLHVNWSESKTINKLWAVGWAFAPPSLASAIFLLSVSHSTIIFVHGQNGEKQKKLCSYGNACYVGLISVPNPR